MTTTLPDDSTTRSVYDAQGRRTSSFDARGIETRYEYDGEGRLRFTRYPDGTSEESRYDGEGRRTFFNVTCSPISAHS